MLNDDIRRLHRFTTSAEASYARAGALYRKTSYDSQNSNHVTSREKNEEISENEPQVTTNDLQNDVDDAIATLIALGIPRTSATRAVNGVLAPGLNVAELVAAALHRT